MVLSHLCCYLISFYPSGLRHSASDSDALLSSHALLSHSGLQAKSSQAALFLAGCSSTATGRGSKSDQDDLK